MQRKSLVAILAATGGGGLLLVACCGACGLSWLISRGGARIEQAGQKEKELEQVQIPVSADELFLAYHDNEAAADLRFAGKIVEVTGGNGFENRQKLYKDPSGNYAYDFRTNVLHDWVLADPRPAVHVVFRKSEAPKLAAGAPRTIRGRCIGRVTIDPSYGGNYPAVVDALVVR
jgi:hypothetical protein